jgi:hypothetical protein
VGYCISVMKNAEALQTAAELAFVLLRLFNLAA